MHKARQDVHRVRALVRLGAPKRKELCFSLHAENELWTVLLDLRFYSLQHIVSVEMLNARMWVITAPLWGIFRRSCPSSSSPSPRICPKFTTASLPDLAYPLTVFFVVAPFSFPLTTRRTFFEGFLVQASSATSLCNPSWPDSWRRCTSARRSASAGRSNCCWTRPSSKPLCWRRRWWPGMGDRCPRRTATMY